MGHKRTFRSAISMSALPLKADIPSPERNVRFVPIADIRSGFPIEEKIKLASAINQRFRKDSDQPPRTRWNISVEL